MKISQQFGLFLAGFFILIFSGCATIKEASKGFMGVSTEVLEQKRSSALKKNFTLGYNDCFAKVQEVLKIKTKGTLDVPDSHPYIYAGGFKEKMLAVYLSATDTTPVGIFFTENSPGLTLIEISSPSLYAQEEMASRIFTALAAYAKEPKEKITDVE